jgi:hypothetical protein
MLSCSFILGVAAFAWLRFSENTVDNDLWGHVLYGQRIWFQGKLEYVDTLSWTAQGHAWINHEYIAEIIMGLAHRIAGGTGLWLMMISFAGATVGLALHEGFGEDGAQRWHALALFVFSVNAIANGFAMRPQLFSMLALVLLLKILRRLDQGSAWWLLVIPLLFAGWVNTHGGYLAGLVVVLTASAAHVFSASSLSDLRKSNKWAVWSFLPVAALMGTLCNPWGSEMIKWTVMSVLLPRPNISEWHPLGFTAPGIVLMAIIVASLFAWRFSSQRRIWCEAAILVVLAAFALRSQRHTPLFCLANLMLTPPHLRSALPRLTHRCRSLVTAFELPSVQWVASILLLCVSAYAGKQSFSLPKEHVFTMEVERNVFPEAAVSFMAKHGLTGNTITFFDWGQQVLWRLPDNPVSFDGRLDTVYPVSIMDAHWRLYEGKNPGEALDVSKAEIALLPVFSPGADLLCSMGWATVYRDGLAEVLIRRANAFPLLTDSKRPVFAKAVSTSGRIPFPSQPALLATGKTLRR